MATLSVSVYRCVCVMYKGASSEPQTVWEAVRRASGLELGQLVLMCMWREGLQLKAASKKIGPLPGAAPVFHTSATRVRSVGKHCSYFPALISHCLLLRVPSNSLKQSRCAAVSVEGQPGVLSWQWL